MSEISEAYKKMQQALEQEQKAEETIRIARNRLTTAKENGNPYEIQQAMEEFDRAVQERQAISDTCSLASQELEKLKGAEKNITTVGNYVEKYLPWVICAVAIWYLYKREVKI
jgi:ABC-type molybdate transport system substrate-binding protein